MIQLKIIKSKKKNMKDLISIHDSLQVFGSMLTTAATLISIIFIAVGLMKLKTAAERGEASLANGAMLIILGISLQGIFFFPKVFEELTSGSGVNVIADVESKSRRIETTYDNPNQEVKLLEITVSGDAKDESYKNENWFESDDIQDVTEDSGWNQDLKEFNEDDEFSTF